MIAHSIDGFRSAVLLTLSSPSQAFRHFHSFVCQEQRLATAVRFSLIYEGPENEDNCKKILKNLRGVLAHLKQEIK